jgi:hypothetical protein
MVIEALTGSSDLLPLIEERDLVSRAAAVRVTTLRQLLDRITETEADTLRMSRGNAQLASKILELTGELERERSEPLNDPKVKRQIHVLESELKGSRQRWKVIKATASAVVAGSGIDWTEVESLRDMVLEPE